MREDSSTKEEHKQEKELRGEMEEEDKVAASKLTCFEDIVEMVGSRGRWNVCLFLLCSFSVFASAFVTMSYQFIGFTPDHWCRVESLKEANWTDQQILDFAIPVNNKTGQYDRCHMYDYNYTKAAQLGYESAVSQREDLTNEGTTKVVTCSVRDFNLTQYKSSIVTEWDLVCERRVLYASTQAANQLGFLISSFLTPIFSDKFGRRPVVLCMAVLTLLQGFASCFSPSAAVFIAFRCGFSATGLSLYLCCFLIVTELCTPSTRSSFGSMFVMLWAVGCMILPGIAFLIRPWRYLQATLVLPYVIFVITYRILPESPRWLLQEGRDEDVEDILLRIATINRRKVPSKTVLRAALTRIGRQMRAEQGEHGELKGKICLHVGRMLRQSLSPYMTAQLACRMCLCLVLWFSVSFAYYGLAFNATNISANIYSYIFLGGVCEVPAYLMLWLLVARAGRRPSLSGLYFICALCIAVNASLMFAFPDVPVAAKISLSLLGKMAIGAAFHLLYLFTAELFTTQQRSIAVGHSCFFGRIGSIGSPYLNDILGETAPWVPSAAYSALSILSCLLSLLLPETRNQNLPEGNHHPVHAKDKKESEKQLKLDSCNY